MDSTPNDTSLKYCRKCQISHFRTNFHKNRSASDGIHSYCKSCRNNGSVIRYRGNREFLQEQARDWKKRNKASALAYDKAWRTANAFYRTAVRVYGRSGLLVKTYKNAIKQLAVHIQSLYENNPFCQACNIALQHGNMHLDHIYPRRTHPELALTPTNLQWICAPCNLRKGARTMKEWLQLEEQQASMVLPRLRKIVGDA